MRSMLHANLGTLNSILHTLEVQDQNLQFILPTFGKKELFFFHVVICGLNLSLFTLAVPD